MSFPVANHVGWRKYRVLCSYTRCGSSTFRSAKQKQRKSSRHTNRLTYQLPHPRRFPRGHNRTHYRTYYTSLRLCGVLLSSNSGGLVKPGRDPVECRLVAMLRDLCLTLAAARVKPRRGGDWMMTPAAGSGVDGLGFARGGGEEGYGGHR